jgi:hypothetical protein
LLVRLVKLSLLRLVVRNGIDVVVVDVVGDDAEEIDRFIHPGDVFGVVRCDRVDNGDEVIW